MLSDALRYLESEFGLDENVKQQLIQHSDQRFFNKPFRVFTPSFKNNAGCQSGCHPAAWQVISLTGSQCALNCAHCQTRLLHSMIPATTPRILRAELQRLAAEGGRGVLLSGGVNSRYEMPFHNYYQVIESFKSRHPYFQIAVHTGMVNQAQANALQNCGVDMALLDIIGARDTITRIYHLKLQVRVFEQSLSNLRQTSMKVIPHIVIGLHFGQLLGEWQALDMIADHGADALVLVVVNPYFADTKAGFVKPDLLQVYGFFQDARARLPGMNLVLGCARPGGLYKLHVDLMALASGLDGIAFPAEGIIQASEMLGRKTFIEPACCSAISAIV